jgi:hypothetical protein
VLEVRYNNLISPRSVVSGLMGEPHVSPQQLQKYNPGHLQSKQPTTSTARS